MIILVRVLVGSTSPRHSMRLRGTNATAGVSTACMREAEEAAVAASGARPPAAATRRAPAAASPTGLHPGRGFRPVRRSRGALGGGSMWQARRLR